MLSPEEDPHEIGPLVHELQATRTHLYLSKQAAEQYLPGSLKSEYHLLGYSERGGGYAVLENKYPDNTTLRTLASIQRAIEEVNGELLLMEADSRPVNLTLGKTRPGFAGHGK